MDHSFLQNPQGDIADDDMDIRGDRESLLAKPTATLPEEEEPFVHADDHQPAEDRYEAFLHLWVILKYLLIFFTLISS